MDTAAAWVLTRSVGQQRARGTVWAHHGHSIVLVLIVELGVPLGSNTTGEVVGSAPDPQSFAAMVAALVCALALANLTSLRPVSASPHPGCPRREWARVCQEEVDYGCLGASIDRLLATQLQQEVVRGHTEEIIPAV